MKRWVCLFVLFAFMPFIGKGQVNVKDSAVFSMLLDFSYGFHVPGGDLSDRFGVNSSLGGSFLFKTKSNWLIGADGYFLFGSDVREDDIFANIEDSEGQVVNRFGEFGDISLLERGFQISFRFGKILPWVGPNPNSGFMILGGVGLLQHHIRIQDNNNNVPQIAGDFKKGYDRLTNGLAVSQFFGYRHLGNKRLINFIAGIELTQAFTMSRREFDFSTMSKDTRSRLDLLYGLRIGWTLPLYKQAPKEVYYD